MSNVRKYPLGLIFGSLLFGTALAGCEEEQGPAEKMGEKIDESIEELGDKMEEAADELEKKTD